MALFNRDYDRDFGYGTRGYRADYDRDLGDRMRHGWNDLKRNTRDFFGGYDRDYDRFNTGYTPAGYRGETGNWRRPRYGRDYGEANRGFRGSSHPYDREYGWGYKSRQETDYGDPFGDRAQRTPIRVTRGRYQGQYDADLWGGARRSRYGRDYETNPAGYDPGRWRRFGRNY